MYRLYADASSKSNRLGWGFVLKTEDTLTEGAGEGSHGINQSELLAVLKGLECVPDGEVVTVYTDSVYVIRAGRGCGRGVLMDLLDSHHGRLRIEFVKVGKGKGACPDHTRAHHLAREIIFRESHVLPQ